METAMSNQTLGTYITSQREGKGWTQRELAKRAKCSHTTINKIENDLIAQPSLDLVLDLSKALKQPVIALIQAYLGKEPDFRKATDAEAFKQLLTNTLSQIIDEQFSLSE